MLRSVPLASLSLLLVAADPALVTAAAPEETGYWDGRFSLALAASSAGLPAFDARGRLILANGVLPMFGQGAFESSARWDGRQWTRLPRLRRAAAITVHEGGAYLAGTPETNQISVLVGTNLTTLPVPVEGAVATLASYSGHLIAGGAFTAGETGGATNVARWDGSAWQPLGAGIPGEVRKLRSVAGRLFAWANGVGDGEGSLIWEWANSHWTALPGFGSPDPGFLRDFTWHGGALVAAVFDTINGLRLLELRQGEWLPLAEGGLGGEPNQIASWREQLVVIGKLTVTTEAGTETAGIAFRDDRNPNARWRAQLAPDLTEGRQLAASDRELVVTARHHSQAGYGGSGTMILHYDGVRWTQLNSGLGATPGTTALAATELGVLAASTEGPFESGAVWDGSRFQRLGVLPDQQGRLIRRRSSVVFRVDKQVLSYGTYPVPHPPEGSFTLARLEGTHWRPVAGPLSVTPTSIAAHGNDYYAGGRMLSGSPIPAAVVRWRDGAWTRLGEAFLPGSGAKGGIVGLIWWNQQLHAIGAFTNAGGADVSYFARWNGTAWEAAAPALNGPVNSLAESAGRLYLSGAFSQAGDLPVTGLAIWDGSAWGAPPPNVSFTNGLAVAVSQDGIVAQRGLYRGGRLRLEVLRGDTWTLISDEIGTDTSTALLWQGHDLYVCGNFIDIGNLQSCAFAIWHEPDPMPLIRRTTAADRLRLDLTGALPESFRVMRSAELKTGVLEFLGSPAQANSVVDIEAGTDRGFFWVEAEP